MNSTREETIKLAKEGVQPMLIAHRLNIDKTTVHNYLAYARRRGQDIPKFTRNDKAVAAGIEPHVSTTPQIAIPVRLYSLLEREAADRNLTITEAAQRLLERGLLGTVAS